MDAVYTFGCDLYGALETEGLIRTVDIIIDGLRKMNDI